MLLCAQTGKVKEEAKLHEKEIKDLQVCCRPCHASCLRGSGGGEPRSGTLLRCLRSFKAHASRDALRDHDMGLHCLWWATVCNTTVPPGP